MNKKLLKKFKSNKGQTSVEYILIIVVIVAAVFLFGDTLKSRLTQAASSLFDNIDSAVQNKTK